MLRVTVSTLRGDQILVEAETVDKVVESLKEQIRDLIELTEVSTITLRIVR